MRVYVCKSVFGLIDVITGYYCTSATNTFPVDGTQKTYYTLSEYIQHVSFFNKQTGNHMITC